jgi:glutamyl-tRNA synthetase
MNSSITRLAPSPTGALHLGNARTFLLNVLMARQNGWRVRMRMEDLDGPRIKTGAAQSALEDLAWLGLEWEPELLYQSHRSDLYQDALQRLIDAGQVYPCTCSRKDVELAGGAPHADDPVRRYPGICRGRWATPEDAFAATGRPVAWRLRVPDKPIRFEDAFAGPQEFTLSETCGDFVLFRNEGLASYQLAVVVDDESQGVTEIVRGDDLLESAARQIHLRRWLGYETPLRYWHVPLVVGEDGHRLAKRHGDTRLSFYRESGVGSNRMLGLLGYWCGLLETRRETDLAELRACFEIGRVPKTQVIFTEADNRFLRA